MVQGFKEMLVKSNLYVTQLSEKESIEKIVKRWNSDEDPISFSTETCNYLSVSDTLLQKIMII